MASNRPAQQLPRATSQDTQGFHAYSDVDGHFPGPAGQAGTHTGWADERPAYEAPAAYLPHDAYPSPDGYASSSSYDAHSPADVYAAPGSHSPADAYAAHESRPQQQPYPSHSSPYPYAPGGDHAPAGEYAPTTGELNPGHAGDTWQQSAQAAGSWQQSDQAGSSWQRSGQTTSTWFTDRATTDTGAWEHARTADGRQQPGTGTSWNPGRTPAGPGAVPVHGEPTPGEPGPVRPGGEPGQGHPAHAWDTADATGATGATGEWDFHELADEPEAAEAKAKAWAGTAGQWERASAADGWDGDDSGPDGSGPGEEWNPTAESIRSVRGRHRVIKQRGGFARSSTVLGVGVIAAVGAGGLASAESGKPPVHISVPDLSSVTGKLPQAKSLPLVGQLLDDGSGDSGRQTSGTPLTSAGLTADDAERGTTDAGEALRERILQQAEQQQDQATSAVQQSAEEAALKKAAEQADEQKEAADKKAAAEKKAAEEEARRKAEAERLAQLAKSFSLPVASYTLTSHYGDAGAMWSSGYHTGLDFAAPTGTPLKAIHTATVKEAGWSGSYGYRTILQLDDGTELWYCHQSSIGVSVGQKVTTGQVIGRVGATGNVTGPHLHLEVHQSAGSASDPLSWLVNKGLHP